MSAVNAAVDGRRKPHATTQPLTGHQVTIPAGSLETTVSVDTVADTHATSITDETFVLRIVRRHHGTASVQDNGDRGAESGARAPITCARRPPNLNVSISVSVS